MWQLKLTATFTTATRRANALAFLDGRYAPGTGTVAPADDRVVNSWSRDDFGNPQIGGCLIYTWQDPADAAALRTSLRQAWTNRATWLDDATTGVTSCVLLIYRHNGCTNGKHMLFQCVRDPGGLLHDAVDTDGVGVVDDELLRRFGGYP